MSHTAPSLAETRYLVLGASGLLGSSLLDALSRSATAYGTYFRRPIAGLMHCDFRDERSVRRAVEVADPHVVFHAAGMTRPDECDADKQAALEVNVGGVRLLVDSAPRSKIVLFSTDYVFDGKKGGYSEDDPTCPINHYGWTKLRAEQALLTLRPDALVVRVAGLFGTPRWYGEFLASSGPEKCIRASSDHRSSYTSVDDVCRYVPGMARLGGVVHLVGPAVLSRVEFARLVCQELNIRVDVVGVPGEEAYPTVPRPRDSSLSSRRVTLPMESVATALRRLRAGATCDGVR